jgi:twitching motility protein PilT
MALVESLLTAIVRADGDALVMHVGERPYVVASAGPIELSTQGLNLQAMAGMTAHLLPPEAQRSLAEFGAVEHELALHPEMQGDRFTVVVARGGDDVWIEIRRHRAAVDAAPLPAPATLPESETAVASDADHVVAAAADVPPVEPQAVAAVEEAERVVPAVEVRSSADQLDAEEPLVEQAAVPAQVPVVAEPSATPLVAAEAPLVVDAGAPMEPGPVEEEPRPVEDVVVEEPSFAAGHVVQELSATVNETPAEQPAVPEPEHQVEPVTVAGSEAEESVAVETPAPYVVAVSADANTDAASTHTVAQASHTEPGQVTSEQEADSYAVASAAGSTRASSIVESSAAGNGTSAAVIPMLRTLRIEVPPSGPSRQAKAPEVERLVALAAARGATALYLTTHSSPYIRVDADVHVLDGEPPLSAVDVESAVLEVVPETTREALRRGEPAEWVADFGDIGSVRCTTFRDHRGPGAIFQLISSRPTSAEQLGLAEEVRALATEIEGLVVVASPRANGKTTVLGSLVDSINRQRPAYVITLERQIHVVHEPQSALISQREVRGTKEELLNVARSAVRENPDVLVIEDLSSPDMCQVALDAAGAGVLVLTTVTAGSTTAALTRVVELFPPDKRRGAQALLAERLRGAVAQVLLRKTGGGRVAAREVLLATSSVTNAIADGRFEDLPQVIDSARKHGLVSLTEALVQLVRTGAIDLREAYRKTDDRNALVAALKRENLETSLLERLA